MKGLKQLDGAEDIDSEDDDSETITDVNVNEEIYLNFDQQAPCLPLTNARSDSLNSSTSSGVEEETSQEWR